MKVKYDNGLQSVLKIGDSEDSRNCSKWNMEKRTFKNSITELSDIFL